MVQVIVNADDFGRHELINRAVAKGVEDGCLRSATLMPGGRAFDDAVRVARAHPGLGVGIHFTLVNGYPVLPPEELPSLVTRDGVFYPDYLAFVKRYFLGRIRMGDVRRELAAQLRKMQATGLRLTHIDSHQHMHTLPGIAGIAMGLAASAGILAVRIPKTALFYRDGNGRTSLGQAVGRFGLWAMASLAKRTAKRKSFAMPEHFAGIVAGDAVTEAYLRDLIMHFPSGTMEIMLHPGTDNRILQTDCQWPHDFEAELSAVTSPKILSLLRRRGIQAASFADLKPN